MLSDIVQNFLLQVFAGPSFAHEMCFWSWKNDEIAKIWNKKYSDPKLSNFLTEFRTCKNAQKKSLDNIAQHLKSKNDVNRPD